MSKPATVAQTNFLEILFGDLGFNRKQRNDWLTAEAGRTITYLDELTIGEASHFIEKLKDRKEDRRELVEEGMGWEGSEDE